MKKKLIIFTLTLLITCVFSPAQASTNSKPAAPYTKYASEKIAKNLNAYEQPIASVAHASSSVRLEAYIKYFNKVYGAAGYDFKKTTEKYIRDLKSNPHSFEMPPLCDYASLEIMTTWVISSLYVNRNDEKVLRRFFSQEAVNYFNKEYQEKVAKNQGSQNYKRYIPQIKMPEKCGEYIINGGPISFATSFPHSDMFKGRGEQIVEISKYPSLRNDRIMFKDISKGIFPSLKSQDEIKETFLISENGVLKCKQIEQNDKITVIKDPARLANEVFIIDITKEHNTTTDLAGTIPIDKVTITYNNGIREIYSINKHTETAWYTGYPTTTKMIKTVKDRYENIIEKQEFPVNEQFPENNCIQINNNEPVHYKTPYDSQIQAESIYGQQQTPLNNTLIDVGESLLYNFMNRF